MKPTLKIEPKTILTKIRLKTYNCFTTRLIIKTVITIIIVIRSLAALKVPTIIIYLNGLCTTAVG